MGIAISSPSPVNLEIVVFKRFQTAYFCTGETRLPEFLSSGLVSDNFFD